MAVTLSGAQAPVVLDDAGRVRESFQHVITSTPWLDDKSFQLLRMGSNIVLASSDAVLRVTSAEDRERVERNLAVVADLAAAGAPVVAPLTRTVGEYASVIFTAWPRLEADGEGREAGLATALKLLHGMSVPASLPPRDAGEDIRGWLAQMPAEVPAEARRMIATKAEAALAMIEELGAGGFAVHGNPHPGNVVRGDGEWRLIDLDTIGVGHRELDLVPAMVAYRRFHRDPARWAAFQQAYADADWQLVERLCLTREVDATGWLACLWNYSEAARAELAHRIATWDEPWQEHPAWSAV